VSPPDSRPPVLFLMGPTASGKTDLAVALTERLPCDIISVDSALVYRDMDIGTAKPGPEVLARAPHRLIDIRDPAESYSAAAFRDDALREIRSIVEEGRIPLLVGGTGLYFRALEQGLASMPEADQGVRARLEAEAAAFGWEALHKRLAEVDPEAAARIHPNDPQRLQRALEVYELTGRPISHWIAEQRRQKPPFRPVKIVVAPPDRQVLRDRIRQRFHLMPEQGLLAEVEQLRRRSDLHRELPSMRAVGYRQSWDFLDGVYNREEFVEAAVTATRQLAKRQLTWLRRESDTQWFDPLRKTVLDSILKSAEQGLIK
jgi:tRNA dimethylallyltransferase